MNQYIMINFKINLVKVSEKKLENKHKTTKNSFLGQNSVFQHFQVACFEFIAGVGRDLRVRIFSLEFNLNEK